MAHNTYQELIDTLRHLIDDGEVEKALLLLEEELNMPYIPPEVETVLRRLESHAKAQRTTELRASVLTPSQILAYLNGDDEHQLAAIVALNELNLRAQLPLVREAFEQLNSRSLKSLLVKVCVDQQLSEELEFVDHGMTYTFIPAALTAPEDSDGYRLAKATLIDWLENDNPSMLMLALQQLDHTVLLKLPESYEADEGLDLAIEVLKPIHDQLADRESWQQFLEAKGFVHHLSTH